MNKKEKIAEDLPSKKGVFSLIIIFQEVKFIDLFFCKIITTDYNKMNTDLLELVEYTFSDASNKLKTIKLHDLDKADA